MTESPSKINAPARACKATATVRAAGFAALSALMSMSAPPAAAADGCTVMLCLAAPNWRGIQECVPPVRQVMRDLSRGKPFPKCEMTGAGNSARHAWSAAPDFCPPQYTREFELEGSKGYSCDYAGAITVKIEGATFSRTWWNGSGDAVTQFSPAAKARLGTWDRRFDDDYAAWRAALPAPADPN